MKMFRVYFTNFEYYSANESDTFDGAVTIAKKSGFQSNIVDPSGVTVATWCPLIGLIKIKHGNEL